MEILFTADVRPGSPAKSITLRGPDLREQEQTENHSADIAEQIALTGKQGIFDDLVVLDR